MCWQRKIYYFCHLGFLFFLNWWFMCTCWRIWATQDTANVVHLRQIWDCAALERNVFDLEGVADHQAVLQFCLFPQMSLVLCVNPFPRCSQARPPGSPPALPPRPPPSPSRARSLIATAFLPFPPFTSSLRNQACKHPPYCYFSPHYTLPQPQPGQAGFPAGGPDGVLASQPALGLWACRTAARPFCGRYGRGQSWHLPVTMDQQGDGKAGAENQCQYTADWGLAHWDVTWMQFCQWPLDGVQRINENKLAWLEFRLFTWDERTPVGSDLMTQCRFSFCVLILQQT